MSQRSATAPGDVPSSLATASTAARIFQLRSLSKGENGESFHLSSRVPAGGGAFFLYLPLRKPDASGDHGKMPSPNFWQRGTCSRSSSRTMSEYCACSATKRSSPSDFDSHRLSVSR